MDLSIIIPHYGEINLLKKCIKSLLPILNNEKIYKCEIIVIFNNKSSIKANIKKLPINLRTKTNIFFETEAKPGSYCARNKGLRLAKGKFIYFLDSDITSSLHQPQKLNYHL